MLLFRDSWTAVCGLPSLSSFSLNPPCSSEASNNVLPFPTFKKICDSVNLWQNIQKQSEPFIEWEYFHSAKEYVWILGCYAAVEADSDPRRVQGPVSVSLLSPQDSNPTCKGMGVQKLLWALSSLHFCLSPEMSRVLLHSGEPKPSTLASIHYFSQRAQLYSKAKRKGPPPHTHFLLRSNLKSKLNVLKSEGVLPGSVELV